MLPNIAACSYTAPHGSFQFVAADEVSTERRSTQYATSSRSDPLHRMDSSSCLPNVVSASKTVAGCRPCVAARSLRSQVWRSPQCRRSIVGLRDQFHSRPPAAVVAAVALPQGVAASEVEVDCLTGDVKIIRADILMDIGASINPAIDIGQIEGAFIQVGRRCMLVPLT